MAADDGHRIIQLDGGDDSLDIGLVAPPWVAVPPPTYGGTEAVIDVLARGLEQAGHRVVLYTTGDATCPVPRRWHHQAAVGTTAPMTGELTHVEAAYRALRDCDVVHDHTLVGPLVATCPDYAHVPVVTTSHGPFTPELREHFRLAAGRAAVVAISRSQASSLPDVPTTVIHHGIDVDAVPVGQGGGDYALFVGRMCRDKGVHVAIDAARLAGIPLKIAAKMWEPDERTYFAEEVEPRLGRDVEYIGLVAPALKHALMGRATVLLNPIMWPEPFGLVMVESLAAGTPVVAFPDGAAPEIIDHGVTGFLSRDLDELAEHIVLAGALDRSACRAAAVARFSATRMVADHVRLYRQTIERWPTRRTLGVPARAGA